MKSSLLCIAISLLLLSGCSFFDSGLEVTDRSFEMLHDVEWNTDLMAYTLRLSATGNTASRKFIFRYLIDGSTDLLLCTLDGSSVANVSTVTFEQGIPKLYVLPSLKEGEEHSMSIVLSEGGVERLSEVELPSGDTAPILVDVDADSASEFTRVTVSNPIPGTSPRYALSFLLDDEPLSGVKHLGNPITDAFTVNFALGGSYTFELPYVSPGGHVLSLVVSSSRRSYTHSQGFTEPQRGNTRLVLSYNSFSGNLMVESPYNPTSASFDFSVGITVTGSVTYRHKQGIGVAAPQTETIRLVSSSSATGITPSLMPVSIDGGTLRQLMDQVHEQSRTDAANFLGNANSRECHFTISSVRLDYTIHSSSQSGTLTPVSLEPSLASRMGITYTYAYGTYTAEAGTQVTIIPTMTVNGSAPGSITEL